MYGKLVANLLLAMLILCCHSNMTCQGLFMDFVVPDPSQSLSESETLKFEGDAGHSVTNGQGLFRRVKRSNNVAKSAHVAAIRRDLSRIDNAGNSRVENRSTQISLTPTTKPDSSVQPTRIDSSVQPTEPTSSVQPTKSDSPAMPTRQRNNVKPTTIVVPSTTKISKSSQPRNQQNQTAQEQSNPQRRRNQNNVELPPTKPMTMGQLWKHIFGHNNKTINSGGDQQLSPDFLSDFLTKNNSLTADSEAEVHYQRKSSSRDITEDRPSAHITTHEESNSETYFGYFKKGGKFLRSRSRDAIWGMLSMLLIVGGLILTILYTRMWRNRHHDWINVQEPLPPVRISLREVIKSRAKYLPDFTKVKWNKGKKYVSFRKGSESRRCSESSSVGSIESESDGDIVFVEMRLDSLDSMDRTPQQRDSVSSL